MCTFICMCEMYVIKNILYNKNAQGYVGNHVQMNRLP